MRIYVFRMDDEKYVRDFHKLEDAVNPVAINNIELVGYAYYTTYVGTRHIYIDVEWDGAISLVYDDHYDRYYLNHVLGSFINKLNYG